VHYHVTERYIFSGSGEDTSVNLGVLLPVNGPYQRIGKPEISWDGKQEKEALGFVDVIKFSGDKTNQENLEARIEYDVRLLQGRISWSAPVEEFQQLPQAGIESDSQCIQEQAAHLGNGTSKKDAYRIYSFTADYLTNSQAGAGCANTSAVSAYELGSCVCAGYARLMTALCRASNIPSQMVIGFIYPDPLFDASRPFSGNTNPAEPHAWVEFNSYGRWYLADPTWGARKSKLLQFNRSDSRHLSYGELEKVLSVDMTLKEWALDQASLIVGDDQCFRYVATSGSDQVVLTSSTSIQKRWDGRWVNTLVIWGITTWLLCKYRFKILGLPSPQAQ
jgi:hypothetical protein